MKCCVVMSDSHGDLDRLRRLLQAIWEQYPGTIDAYIHCGDGARDFETIRDECFYHDPRAQFYCVRGNCDLGEDVPEDALVTLEGVSMYVCHGHRYRVRMGTMLLAHAASKRGCTLALYGHTHRSSEKQSGGVTMVNPGSAADGCMMLVQIDGDAVTINRLHMEGGALLPY